MNMNTIPQMKDFRKLKNLVALVTGGASGLGLATVQRFVKEGNKVAMCDLPTSQGKKEAESLGENNCLFIPVDVTNYDQVRYAVDQTLKKFGCIDVNVNCAGVVLAKKIFNMQKQQVHPMEDFDKVMKVNVYGTFNVIAECVHAMDSNKPDLNDQRGVIINTSSVAAFEGQMGQVAYAASKGAIVGMSLPMARDLSNAGIRCVAIAPGLIDTPLLQGLPEKAREVLSMAVPFPRRLGKPEEFAHLVQAIVENPLINGTTIRLDGAVRMPF